jgi:superfamily I DNA/RNA helicase
MGRAMKAPLPDAAARVTALTAIDRSLLVEAGAGSGKTALMAGRVAVLLANGVEPKHVAAVTFTEFAASELLQRINRFVDAPGAR